MTCGNRGKVRFRKDGFGTFRKPVLLYDQVFTRKVCTRNCAIKKAETTAQLGYRALNLCAVSNRNGELILLMMFLDSRVHSAFYGSGNSMEGKSYLKFSWLKNYFRSLTNCAPSQKFYSWTRSNGINFKQSRSFHLCSLYCNIEPDSPVEMCSINEIEFNGERNGDVRPTQPQYTTWKML